MRNPKNRRIFIGRVSSNFTKAAAVCDGACSAMSCLRGADLRKGRSILIYGASGSIGTAAVQLARHFGASVTAVCNTKNVALVRSLGADEVVDYTRENFAKNGKTAAYKGVDEGTAERLSKAPSVGQMFLSEIKPFYTDFRYI